MIHEDFSRIISTPVDKSPGEIFLMLMEFALSQKLPINATSTLFQFVNSIFQEAILPESSYMLDKLLNSKTHVKFHGICPACSRYIGQITDSEPTIQCDICLLNIDISKPSLDNIFMVIDPSEAVSTIINANDDFYDFIMNERTYDGSIKDIFDGKLYRSFVKSLPIHERTSYLTAILNRDGAPPFESSKSCIWPVYLSVNEIPISIRLKSPVVCGMWFGKSKPPMHTFLEPLVSKLNELSNIGIECTVKNKTKNLKLHVIIACVDSVAGAPMQGFKQFNGKFGCPWCLHPGEYFAGSIRYPILMYHSEKRTKDQTVQFMQILCDNSLKEYYGIKGVSPLINLQGFDIVEGFVPDYMHCCLAGVGKQITEYILQRIPDKISVIDKYLKNIKAPQQLSRLSRLISERGDWKAKEWENFILHYSVPIFKKLLDADLLRYWILFVDALHILLRQEITSEELDHADEMLHEFNTPTQEFFTKKGMTSNMHRLLHLSTSVLNWGPLWAHSTFPFESANHDVLQTIHCAKGVNLQILRFLNYQRCSNLIKNKIYPQASFAVRRFCGSISQRTITKSCKINCVTYLGNTTIINPMILNNCQLSKYSTIYKRVVINGCLYTSDKGNKRSNNSCCQMIDGTFQKILYFVIDDEYNKEVVLCKEIRTGDKINDSIYQIDFIDNEIRAKKIDNIKMICVFLTVENINYISILPNLYHN